jgi:hypothetical protein
MTDVLFQIGGMFSDKFAINRYVISHLFWPVVDRNVFDILLISTGY